MVLTEFHVGIDDTDSKFGGCTTYTAALIFEKLVESSIAPTDFPWLVRLNPNIPWKTRGNGALAIHLRTDSSRIKDLKRIVVETVRHTSDPSIPATDPAAVFLQGPISEAIQQFSSKALHDVITIREAERLLLSASVEAHAFKGRRGIIGALAAIGYGPDRDYTYEIIAYRTNQYLGKPRRVDLESVRRMDRHNGGRTFNNLDPETGRILVCPHGPDPVLLGIRGEDPLGLLEAFREVDIQEPIERVMLFRTNHGTDAHLTSEKTIGQIAPYQSVIINGWVHTRPSIIKGGHVIFNLRDQTGSIDCATYEPTGSLRKIVNKLIPGDRVRALGGVRPGPYAGLTLNLEKLQILQMVEDLRYVRPRCSQCGSSCESMGKKQGFRCRRCGRRFSRELVAPSVTSRTLSEGTHIPPPRAHRHLTKPESRWSNSPSRLAMRREDSTSLGPTRLETYDLAYFRDLLRAVRPASRTPLLSGSLLNLGR